MATKKNSTELAVAENFALVDRYEGMDPEELAELQDELGDLDAESGISCRMIKIPAGGGLAYEVQGDDDDDVEYMKEISGVIVFTHRMNGYWPDTFGSGDNGGDKIPACSSMDGKTGLWRDTGEVRNCETCPMNQFGSATDGKGGRGKGKACKNMRRLYLVMSGDPNLYLLTVPPTSIKEVNRQLFKIMRDKNVTYTGMIVNLTLEKAVNANNVAYSKVVIKDSGYRLSKALTAQVKAMRLQVKDQYQAMAITMDDYATAPAQDASPVTVTEAEFTEIETADDPELPFN